MENGFGSKESTKSPIVKCFKSLKSDKVESYHVYLISYMVYVLL